MAKNWAAYGNVSKKSVPKTKQVTEHRYPVDPQKLAHDIAQLDFETKREKRKGTQLGLETAKFIKTGTPSFGGLLKPLLIGFVIIFIIVGPSAGIIFQLSSYLSPTIILWVGGLLALILYIRRR